MSDAGPLDRPVTPYRRVVGDIEMLIAAASELGWTNGDIAEQVVDRVLAAAYYNRDLLQGEDS